MNNNVTLGVVLLHVLLVALKFIGLPFLGGLFYQVILLK